MERSFEFFKELLLRHSVQRPPFSVGLFSFQEMKAITEWMMDSYYRHYKLYQVRTLPTYPDVGVGIIRSTPRSRKRAASTAGSGSSRGRLLPSDDNWRGAVASPRQPSVAPTRLFGYPKDPLTRGWL